MTHRERILAALAALCGEAPCYGPQPRLRGELLDAIDEALLQAHAEAVVGQWPVWRRAEKMLTSKASAPSVAGASAVMPAGGCGAGSR